MYRGLKFYSDSVSEQSCTINHLLYHEDGKMNTKHVHIQHVHHSSLWHYDYGMYLAPPSHPWVLYWLLSDMSLLSEEYF